MVVHALMFLEKAQIALALTNALTYALLVQGGDICTIGEIISNVQAGTLASLTIDVSLTSMGKMPPAAADVEGPSPRRFRRTGADAGHLVPLLLDVEEACREGLAGVDRDLVPRLPAFSLLFLPLLLLLHIHLRLSARGGPWRQASPITPPGAEVARAGVHRDDVG